MAKRTTEITLGGDTYMVHAFNLGELERISDLLHEEQKEGRLGFNILRIAMERAEPKCEDVSAIEMTLDEVAAASAKLMELAGMAPKKKDDGGDPPQGQETGEA